MNAAFEIVYPNVLPYNLVQFLKTSEYLYFVVTKIFHYKMINIILFYLLYRVAIHGSYQKRIRTLVFWFLDWQRIYTNTKFYLIENFVKIKIYFLSKNKKISNQMYANTKMVANVLQILNNRMLVVFSIKNIAEKSIKNFFRT